MTKILNETTTSPASTPWYVRVLLGISAWVSAILISIGIFAITGIEDSLVIFGLVFIGACFYLKKNSTSVFLSQLAFAGSAVGQVSLAVGIGNIFDSMLVVATIMLVVEILLLLIFPDLVHKIISTVLAVIAVKVILVDLEVQYLESILIIIANGFALYIWNKKDWHNEQMQTAIRYALPVSVFVLLWLDFQSFNKLGFEETLKMIMGLANVGLIAYQAHNVMKELHIDIKTWLGVAIASTLLILLIPSVTVPALLIALLYVIVAIQYRNKLLLGLAILGFIISLSYFYYSLEITLLEKSILMSVTGGLLLIVRTAYLFFRKKIKVLL